VRECGGVGDLLGWTSLRIVPPVVWLTALATALELSRGSKAFANGSVSSARPGCGVNRPGESGDYGVVGEGLVTYRAQGWAAISPWSWVVV
jgi:hypothetical protein